MPREQVEWYVKQSLLDNERDHTRQCCTYYSIVNVDQTNHPYSSSFEREQTWTLTRTMSQQNKRYQSSIENIHLTNPSLSNMDTAAKVHKIENKNEKIKIDRSISLLPPLPPPRQHASLSHRLNRTEKESELPQQQTLTNHNSSSKVNLNQTKSQLFTNPMRIMHINGEFVVRI